jgi:branched-subunit amino acid aminotransferase/4-amino-4-deoxychorismate lyase
MSPHRLIETMLWNRGVELLDEHYRRFARSLILSGVSPGDVPDLEAFAEAVEQAAAAGMAREDEDSGGLLKLRMVYDPVLPPDQILPGRITAEPFVPRRIWRVGIIELPAAEYGMKREDRRLFAQLHRRHPGFDEIIITRRGLLTDGTWTNLYYRAGSGPILTPDPPLLAGTRRERLIREGKITPAALRWDQVRVRKGAIGFINALNPPGSLGEIAPEFIVELGTAEPVQRS